MHSAPAYTAETEGVVVRVRPSYLAGQSDPAGGRWVWAYQIEIVNLTGSPVQLVARRWTITDAYGHVEEVRGQGVVGEQPVIEAGEMVGLISIRDVIAARLSELHVEKEALTGMIMGN